MAQNERQIWTYKGVDVHPITEINGSGLRWWAFHPKGDGILRADTKQSMRELITENK